MYIIHNDYYEVNMNLYVLSAIKRGSIQYSTIFNHAVYSTAIEAIKILHGIAQQQVVNFRYFCIT